ncbi:hypothetical protein BLA13014_00407 [Burkholderia aenigmatica]|uniref:Uncharacterized protein n=1 Tax=Burkholderia aenigmatica TaxID=2015348 RepID=A0A6P2HC40_9BURK|nr:MULTISPECIES: hypothetical protein [Burkholderia]VWB14949.1 hypothetical protein BLA13014_00407 [Burkholderia aenigmatica]
MDDLELPDDESQAYCDGWNAYGEQADFTMGNPFPFLSLDYHDWQRGWTDAQADAWEEF